MKRYVVAPLVLVAAYLFGVLTANADEIVIVVENMPATVHETARGIWFATA